MDDSTIDDNIQTETSELDGQLLASRKTLKESHHRLMGLSNYCNKDYMDNRKDSHSAKNSLAKTKQYTTQSLASVAYQINTLATTFISILQMQTAQLNILETSINKVCQKVDLYQEKVARRDIGKLANKRNVPRSLCVRRINQNEVKLGTDLSDKRSHKYIHRGIDFSILDNVGIGGAILRNSILNSNNQSKTNISGLNSRPGSMYQSQYQNVPNANVPFYNMANVNNNRLSSHSNNSSNHSYNQYHQSQNIASIHKRSTSNTHSSNSSNSNPMTGHAQLNIAGHYGTMGKNVKLPEVQALFNTLKQKEAPENLTTMTKQQYQQYMMKQNHQIMSPSEIPSPPGPNTLPVPDDHFENSVQNVQQLQQQQNQSSQQQFQNYTPSEHIYQTLETSKTTQWLPPQYLEKVSVLFDYTPDQDDELELRENEIIYVTAKNDDGWWQGIKGPNCSGMFPNNYVKKL